MSSEANPQPCMYRVGFAEQNDVNCVYSLINMSLALGYIQKEIKQPGKDYSSCNTSCPF